MCFVKNIKKIFFMVQIILDIYNLQKHLQHIVVRNNSRVGKRFQRNHVVTFTLTCTLP